MTFTKIAENNDEQKKEDRLRVLLALESSETKDVGSCPDSNDMAAFIDGTLEPEEHQKIKAHIDDCKECYDNWRAISSSVAESKIGYVFNEVKMVLTDFINCFSMPKPALTYGFTTAAAVCLVIAFWVVQSPNLKGSIDSSFTSDVVSGISQEDLEIRNIFKLPWEQPEALRAFSPLPPDSDAARAFGAGLWSARQEVLGGKEFPSKPDFVDKEWLNTPREVDFWIGHWSYLLRAVCLSDEKTSQDFWEKQLLILRKIQKKYSNIHKENEEVLEVVNPRLTQIKSTLNKIKGNTISRESRRFLASEFDLLIEYLSPKYSDNE